MNILLEKRGKLIGVSFRLSRFLRRPIVVVKHELLTREAFDFDGPWKLNGETPWTDLNTSHPGEIADAAYFLRKAREGK
jgi:hypothetical protein